MRAAIAAIFAMSLALASLQARAEECKQSQGSRQPVDAIMASLLQQGYQRVLSIEIRIDNCYDVVAIDKSGKKVDLDVDPVTVKAVLSPPSN